MAINRALMNRQMYNMGGPSLQAGAPDITLTGDMRPTYSAMRKQRMAYGGIAGADGRKNYGIGSFFQEKIMDPIKNNPITSAVIGGGLLNQFGVPDVLTKIPGVGQYIDPDFGQNFLGDLLSKVVPGNTDFNTVIGDGTDFFGQLTGPGGGDPNDIGAFIGDQTGYTGGPVGIEGVDLNYPDIQKLGEAYQSATDPTQKSFLKSLYDSTLGKVTGALTGDSDQAKLAKALAAGAAAGAYVDSQPKDTIPADTTGLDIPAIAQAARGTDAQGAAAGLRFLPDQVTRAANGGRIGFYTGGGIIGNQEDFNKFLEDMKQRDMSGMQDQILRDYKNYMKRKKMIEQMPEAKDGGRIGAQEGGLMNLGGMEKDYREEGGFVPIGGREKADDVPARLSKNEFVFTADAVRNAGGGDIDQGAQVMERLMKSLEQGGQVSEESQGLEGAREMFETSQRLEKRII